MFKSYVIVFLMMTQITFLSTRVHPRVVVGFVLLDM